MRLPTLRIVPATARLQPIHDSVGLPTFAACLHASSERPFTLNQLMPAPLSARDKLWLHGAGFVANRVGCEAHHLSCAFHLGGGCLWWRTHLRCKKIGGSALMYFFLAIHARPLCHNVTPQLPVTTPQWPLACRGRQMKSEIQSLGLTVPGR